MNGEFPLSRLITMNLKSHTHTEFSFHRDGMEGISLADLFKILHVTCSAAEYSDIPESQLKNYGIACRIVHFIRNAVLRQRVKRDPIRE